MGVFTCLDIALQHIFNPLMNFFEPGDHSSAIESIFSSLPNTKNDNDPIILHESLVFTTRHVPRTLLTKKGAQRSIPRSHRPRHDAPGRVTTVFEKAVHDSNELGPIFFVAPELGSLSKIGCLSNMVWELAKGLVSPGRGSRRHLTVLQRRPEGRDKPPEGVRHRARPLDRRIQPKQVRGWSPLWRCRRLWSFLATPYPTFYTISYSSSSIRSPSSSSARSASAVYVKEKVSNRY